MEPADRSLLIRSPVETGLLSVDIYAAVPASADVDER